MRFYLLSLGCPKNLVESEGMRALLRQAGYQSADHPEDADILIVNTCGFIDRAKEESVATLRELGATKKPDQYLVAAGCMAERYGGEMRRMVPSLDGIIGTQRWTEIAHLAEDLLTDHRPGALHQLPQPGPSHPVIHPLPRHCPDVATAYVKIAEGCDAPCAFCAIPQIKGAFRSKPKEAILTEVRQLVQQDVREIILIAQDITAYGRDRGERDALPSLICDILTAAPTLPWLRLMYTYPQHVTPRLIETMVSNPQICHYLDLPLQHAHPDVLRRMNRPHHVGQIRSLMARLRQAMPDIALRTSFIVGYPGETEEEFEGLLEFMEQAEFDRVGIFTYSQEEGTKAARLPDQVPDKVKQDRYELAMTLQQSISLRKNETFVGQELEVLIEGVGDGISVGRSYRDAPEVDGMVLVEGELPVGEFCCVKIRTALEYDLVGEPAESPCKR
jgi:ribosomal protein S12 methylthiotransferase